MPAVELLNTPIFNDANLVAYYRLETSAVTTDSKGANTLTAVGTVNTTVSGKFGAAADFGSANTTNWLHTVSDDLGLAGNSTISISLWIKLQTQPATSTTKTIVQHASPTTLDRYMRLNYKDAAGTKQIELDMSGTKTTFNIDLGTTTFRNLVIIRDIANTRGQLYVDGVVQISAATLGTGVYSAKRFDLGGDEDGSNGAISAFIDDTAVFSRVLTATECSNIFNGWPLAAKTVNIRQAVNRASRW